MTLDEKVEEVNQRVYGGDMPSHNRKMLRSMLEKEQREEEKWGEFCNADIIRGYDDGEWLEPRAI